MEQLIKLLPNEHTQQLRLCMKTEMPDELRLCAGQPILMRVQNKETRIWPSLTQENVDMILRAACRQSVYAYNETIRQGYITVDGGHRIGICGFGVVQNGDVQSIRSVSSLVIRVAKQITGCADRLLPQIVGSTLLLGPPGSGKTTLLRDLVRQLSDRRRQRVALADERGEISAGVLGTPQLQIGERTDVLINIPKAKAAMMLIRTMNPQWVAMDEITSEEDVLAMEQIAYCGVHVLATAHGFCVEDLAARPIYRKMMACGIFRKIVVLAQDKSFYIQEV